MLRIAILNNDPASMVVLATESILPHNVQKQLLTYARPGPDDMNSYRFVRIEYGGYRGASWSVGWNIDSEMYLDDCMQFYDLSKQLGLIRQLICEATT